MDRSKDVNLFFFLVFYYLLWKRFVTLIIVFEVGENCTINNSSIVGVCTLLSDCPRVEEDAKSGISPTICGFHSQNAIPIVCCESTYNFTSITLLLKSH